MWGNHIMNRSTHYVSCRVLAFQIATVAFSVYSTETVHLIGGSTSQVCTECSLLMLVVFFSVGVKVDKCDISDSPCFQRQERPSAWPTWRLSWLHCLVHRYLYTLTWTFVLSFLLVSLYSRVIFIVNNMLFPTFHVDQIDFS